MWGRKGWKEEIRISCTSSHLWYCCLLSLKYRHIPQIINTSEYKALWGVRKEMRRCAMFRFTKLSANDPKARFLFFHYMLNMLL